MMVKKTRNYRSLIKKAVLYIQSKLIKIIIWPGQFTRTEFNLRSEINKYYNEFYLRMDFSKHISKIFNGKLIHLDVGARGGSLGIVKKYSKFIKTILCDPEKNEAKRLSSEGYEVIDKALYKAPGKIKFFESRMPEASSIYKSQGPFLDFYNSDPEYLSLYDIIKVTTMECSTISTEFIKMNIPELDFLKIDTQGAELDVLMGLGKYRPLIMQVEIEYLPLYQDIPNAYQVCQYLFELGYIPFALTSNNDRILCPICGDGLFMPNWVDPKGIELIRSREEKYIALMLMFGQAAMLKFVNQKIKLRNDSFIKTL